MGIQSSKVVTALIVTAVLSGLSAVQAQTQAPSPAADASAGDPLSSAVQHALVFAAQRLDLATQSIATNRYPSTTGSSGAWSTTDAAEWTSGFFPGCLWLMYDWSGDSSWRTDGGAWLVALESQKNDTSTHDVGFKIFPSFGNAYRLTGNDAQRLVVLAGATSLATRYSSIVGAIRSWNGPTSSDFRVIIDNMLNLEILFWGAGHGGNQAWTSMAVSHALKTRENHVRADGTTYQLVNYNPTTGAVKEKGTHQGYDDESTWSRGQAWAVYGFTMSYRETGDARFLDTARWTADYFVAHLPADSVPYWDFELPTTQGEPRDSSAAAIAASGLLELARIESDALRSASALEAARRILTSLTSPAYLSEETGNAAVLLHGTQNRPDDRYDTGLIYGDYYFVEALLRYQRWFDLAPRAADVAVETRAGEAVEVALSASDPQECELLFAVVDPPAHGSLGPQAAEACVPVAPHRDSARVAYLPAAGFTGTDSFTYRASDGTNDSNLARVALTVLPPVGPESTFLAGADSKINSDSPGSNYGTETTLRVRTPSPGEWRSYLKFTVTGFGGAVAEARVRLYATDGSNDAGRIFAVGSTWTETGLTWNNAPVISGSALDTGGPVATGAWAEYEVTPAVGGNGTFSFALTSSSTDSAYFSSRQGAQPPELVLRSGAPPADTTPPAVVSRTPAADASGVALTASVTATFDEPVVGVSGTTFILRQGATALASSVSYDSLTKTATLDPVSDLAPGTTYTASLTGGVTDAATPPNTLVPVSWSFTTGEAPPLLMTFTAGADSKVNSDSPGSNYGTETTLRVRAPSPGEWRSYLKFTVSGFSGTVAEAKVRLYATDGSNDAGRIFAVGSTWTETGLTWNNAPAIAGSALDAGGPVATGAWAEYDVTPAVGGNGTFSFALTSSSTDSAYFSSRQGAQPPELVLRSGAPLADTTPPAVVGRTPAADASGVALTASVTATFDEPVVGVSGTTFVLSQGATAVAASVSYDSLTKTATLDPVADLAPGTTYTASLTGGITDAATPPNALVPVSWSFTTGEAPPLLMTFTAGSDSKINSASPTRNYGTETTLRVRAPNPEEWRTYLKFTVTGFSGTVGRARVRLYATDGSNDAGRIFAVGNTWTETGLTWNNAPAIAGGSLGGGGSVATGAWAEYDVTAAVSGNGSFSFALTSSSADSAYFSSREGTHPPELVLSTPGS